MDCKQKEQKPEQGREKEQLGKKYSGVGDERWKAIRCSIARRGQAGGEQKTRTVVQEGNQKEKELIGHES